MKKRILMQLGPKLSVITIAATLLVACDETGGFVLPGVGQTGTTAAPGSNAPPARATQERDVERPDIFEVNDRGLWDGRPSLGGIWVAHPDVQDPERVLIRNTENGREIIGALFRRERENPGPLLQVSSDAAEGLGVLAGAPTVLSVVALRREDVDVAPDPSENPVVESLDAPVNVEAAPLEPIAEPVVEEVPEPAPEPVAVVLPPAVEAATAAIEETATNAAAAVEATPEILDLVDAVAPEEGAIDVSSVLSAPVPPLDGPKAQVGVFSVELNANASAGLIIDNGIDAVVLPETMGGRTVWRVIAGPMFDESGIDQLKALGFVDAYVASDEDE